MPPRCQLLSGSLHIRRPPTRLASSTHRAFTTSLPLYNALRKKRGGDLGTHLPKHIIPPSAKIPEYPYGPALLFKQSNKGLYGGQTIQFGNNVSPDTETKSRRHWKPNILNKGLYSVALNKRIKLRLTSKVLKVMDREGGLDEYLLKESETRIKELGPMGWKLRWTLMQTPSVIARFRAEAKELGISDEVIDKQWPKVPVSKQQLADARLQKRKVEKARQKAEVEEQQRRIRIKLEALKLRKQTEAAMPKFYRTGTTVNRAVAEKLATVDVQRTRQIIQFASRRVRKDYALMPASEREGASGLKDWIAERAALRIDKFQRLHKARLRNKAAAKRESKRRWEERAKAKADRISEPAKKKLWF